MVLRSIFCSGAILDFGGWLSAVTEEGESRSCRNETPHPPQKWASIGLLCPHPAQSPKKCIPHPVQWQLVVGFSVLQLGHSMKVQSKWEEYTP